LRLEGPTRFLVAARCCGPFPITRPTACSLVRHPKWRCFARNGRRCFNAKVDTSRCDAFGPRPGEAEGDRNDRKKRCNRTVGVCCAVYE
jgi:hypothetical protein